MFWLNLSDCHQRLPAVVQKVSSYYLYEVDFGKQNLQRVISTSCCQDHSVAYYYVRIRNAGGTF